MVKHEVRVQNKAKVPFHNNVDYCIGTGRMGLALQREYLEQLKMVQEEIGFCHIRGHGLFCDDMAIYQEYEEDGVKKVEYNFTYLDMVMDQYTKLGLRPFLELGFMPYKMASGTQTVFYWKGNTTPPKEYEAWTDMIKALLYHLMERYGTEEVVQWPIEVWNEPNLAGFWENADMQEYFKLFHHSFTAIKSVDQRFRVGGPAVCGGSDEEWIRAFLMFCREQNLAVDFVTRHHYTTHFPEKEGHYGYAELMEPEYGFTNLQTTRAIIDCFPEYAGLEIHITEFNTSYIPNCPLHDTNENAAFLAHQLSRLGDVNESYSYWTFGDIFEEFGVPFTPFHGGFGLLANGCIPKPTFWTFVFYKKLQEFSNECVLRTDNVVVLRDEYGNYQGVAWNLAEDMELAIELYCINDDYVLIEKRVDEEVCNPLKVWHDIGEPAYLTDAQLKLIKEGAYPQVTSKGVHAEHGHATIVLQLRKNAVVYFTFDNVKFSSDRGYDYNRVVKRG